MPNVLIVDELEVGPYHHEPPTHLVPCLGEVCDREHRTDADHRPRSVRTTARRHGGCHGIPRQSPL